MGCSLIDQPFLIPPWLWKLPEIGLTPMAMEAHHPVPGLGLGPLAELHHRRWAHGSEVPTRQKKGSREWLVWRFTQGCWMGCWGLLGLLWIIMDYYGLLWIIMDSYGIIMYYYGIIMGLLWIIMDYYGLLWIIMGLLCIIMDYYGLLWIIMDYYGIIMDYYGIIMDYYGLLWDSQMDIIVAGYSYLSWIIPEISDLWNAAVKNDRFMVSCGEVVVKEDFYPDKIWRKVWGRGNHSVNHWFQSSTITA